MDNFEFELRYKSFAGLSKKFGLGWGEDELVSLVCVSGDGIPDKVIQEILPDELKTLTLQTYTTYKLDFLEKNGQKKLSDHGTMRVYIDRLEYELKVIKEMWFNTYMLIVSDYVQEARKMKIVVGPGRGSGAGSLLSRVIEITDVDPLAYDLLFERFLNPARISMPDFDIDFEDELREKVIKYVTDKYGAQNVCSIGTFMQMATKAAFKDVARALGVPFDRSNYISTLFPEKGSVLDDIHSPDGSAELKSQYNADELLHKAIDLSAKLEGNIRQLGVHACGIIIAPEQYTHYTAVQSIDKGDKGVVSHYDGGTLETIGLLKMDFLGLRNLSVIKNCIKVIIKRHHKAQEIAQKSGEVVQELPQMFVDFMDTMQFYPPMGDPLTFQKVFQPGDTTGIFQFEGEGMRKFLVQLKATDINDLFAMNALYRPGPLEFIPTYIKRKHGEEKVDYMLPELEIELLETYDKKTVAEQKKKLTEDLGPIMDITYGIAVYQEQLMFLVQAMAGFSLPEADLLRRGVGKKKISIIEKLKKEFIVRAEEFRGYKPETGKIIYEKMIEPAASYSFNKSHSVCYAYIAYQTGYLKAHYPLEFYAALMRSVEEDTDKLSEFIMEAQMHGFAVLTPDINVSFNHIAAIDNDVRLGFLSVKGLGYSIGEFIQQERKQNGLYKDLEDFLNRCSSIVNKKSLESLAMCGALDAFADRKTLVTNLQQILERSQSSGQIEGGLFGAETMDTSIVFQKQEITTLMDKIRMEYGLYKTFVSFHPFDGLYPYLKKQNFISQFKNKEEFGDFVFTGIVKKITRAKKKGFFIMIEDVTDAIEIFFTDKLDFDIFDVCIVRGKKSKYLSVDEIITLDIQGFRDRIQATGKYDERRTVVKVKEQRQGS